jgi:hypothetical protein
VDLLVVLIVVLGSFGIFKSAERDLRSAHQYPDRWNVALQARIVSLSRWTFVAACVGGFVVVIYNLVASR